MKIALFNPDKNLYSETFIEAHKLYLKDKVFFYYGHAPNIELEGQKLHNKGVLFWVLKFVYKITGKNTKQILESNITKSLKKNKIDVILIEYGTHAFKLLGVLKKVNLPVVVHFHGYDASRYRVIENCNNYHDVFNIANKVIAVSKVMYNKLLDIGCPENKLVYNVYGPRDEFKNILPNYSNKQFIAIGRFADKKAPYHTILAFKEVLKVHPEAILIMAGDGMLLNTCMNLVKAFNMESQVKFPGVINREEFIDLIKTSVAFVQHSVTALDGDMEGTPLSVLEASLAGLPVISTRHAGIPDVIVHGKTGLLCDEHDVKTMSSNMLYILNNPKEGIEMGKKGKEHIKQNYNIRRHISKLQSILEEVVQ